MPFCVLLKTAEWLQPDLGLDSSSKLSVDNHWVKMLFWNSEGENQIRPIGKLPKKKTDIKINQSGAMITQDNSFSFKISKT